MLILLSLSEPASREVFSSLPSLWVPCLGQSCLQTSWETGTAAGHSAFQFTLDFEKVTEEKLFQFLLAKRTFQIPPLSVEFFKTLTLQAVQK